jgi:hypothetical protein
MGGAAWVAKLLRRELFDILQDVNLSTSQRRDLVLKYSKAITQSIPNSEIFEARELVRADESKTGKPNQLQGKVGRAAKRGARPLRATAPRGKAG